MFLTESLKRVQMRKIQNTQIRNMKYKLWDKQIPRRATRVLDRKFNRVQPGQIQKLVKYKIHKFDTHNTQILRHATCILEV